MEKNSSVPRSVKRGEENLLKKVRKKMEKNSSPGGGNLHQITPHADTPHGDVTPLRVLLYCASLPPTSHTSHPASFSPILPPPHPIAAANATAAYYPTTTTTSSFPGDRCQLPIPLSTSASALLTSSFAPPPSASA